jgi:putative SOS response-associated peptidase YedK
VDGELLAAAGSYTGRKVDDEWRLLAVIITRPVGDESGEIHDRMPVFLERAAWHEWLNPSKLDTDGNDHMIAMLTAESDGMASVITSYEVDSKVNNTRRADPSNSSLIAPSSG